MIQQHSQTFISYIVKTEREWKTTENGLAKLVVSSVLIDDESKRKKEYFLFFIYCVLVNWKI